MTENDHTHISPIDDCSDVFVTYSYNSSQG